METYLGDGVYASRDGFGSIKLRVPADSSLNGCEQVIYLDGSVQRELIRFITQPAPAPE